MDFWRLPRHVVPTRYDLRLEPDLATCSFQGDEVVALTIREATAEILLHAVELAIDQACITDGAVTLPATEIALQKETERCRLKFAQPITPGHWCLHLQFRGKLNDKLRGFYRSTYRDADGATHLLAATQFESTDARRAFPCWDEPDFKAVFATTLVIDPSCIAISNTSVRAEAVENGKKIVHFADTIPMSTYLVAFVVGNLEATPPVLVGHTPLRLWSVPGKSRLAHFGREIAAFSLRFFEEYYARDYPSDKLDLLAIPDFAAGAMENLGAITFRETALLVDEHVATQRELERIADVVSHENAHMWFGDLVTMSWWNGLWLKEAFATFMEMLAVDAWKPEWQRWTSFGVSRSAALMVDGLHSTRPIEYPVQAPRDAEAMFDVLTYEKGASVLRMIEQYLGPELFRDGVRCYLNRHAFGNTETGDLWIALGEVAQQPWPEIMDGWIFQPGCPLIVVRLEDHRLILQQQRFHYLPPDNQTTAAPRLWQIPLQLRIDGAKGSTQQRMLLKDAETTLPLPADFETVLVNEGGHGFYRVHYAPELLEQLLRRVPAGLAAIDRFNLVNDVWAAVLAGLTPLTDYLDLTACFRAERDKNVWAVLIGSLQSLYRLLEPVDRPVLETLVRDRVGSAVADLGWVARPGEDELLRYLRGDLLRTLGTLGNDATLQAQAVDLYAEYQQHPDQVDANVLSALIAILAHTGDSQRYEEFLERFSSAPTPQEEQRYLYALTAFQPAPLIQQTLAFTLNGTIRTQDAPFVLRSLLMNVFSRALTWEFVQANWDEMCRQYPVNGLRRMYEGIIGLATPAWEQQVHRFFSENQIDLGGKTLQQYLEQLRVQVALREREGDRLPQTLGQAITPS